MNTTSEASNVGEVSAELNAEGVTLHDRAAEAVGEWLDGVNALAADTASADLALLVARVRAAQLRSGRWDVSMLRALVELVRTFDANAHGGELVALGAEVVRDLVRGRAMAFVREAMPRVIPMGWGPCETFGLHVWDGRVHGVMPLASFREFMLTGSTRAAIVWDAGDTTLVLERDGVLVALDAPRAHALPSGAVARETGPNTGRFDVRRGETSVAMGITEAELSKW